MRIERARVSKKCGLVVVLGGKLVGMKQYLLLPAFLAAPLTVPALASAQAQRLSRQDVSRFAAVMQMADMRTFDTTAVDMAMSSKSAAVRREAALAMGQVGRSPKSWANNSVPQRYRLYKLLNDQSTSVTAAVAYALGLLKDTVSVDSLARIARSGGSTGENAAWSLGQIGSTSAKQISELLKSNNDSGTTVQLLLAAGKMRPFPLKDIVPYLQNSNGKIVWAAAYAISRNRVAQGIPALLSLYDSVNANPKKFASGVNDIKAEIARALVKKGAELAGQGYSERAFAVVQSLARDHYPQVRVMALRSLALYTAQGRQAIMQALKDQDPNVRATAAEALTYVIDSTTTQKDWSAVWQADTSMGYRFNVLMAVARHGGYRGYIVSWVGSEDWELRMLSAQAVAVMKDTANRAIYTKRLIADPDPRVRGRMYSSLVAEGTEPDSAARQLLTQALESDPDSIVRQLVRVPLKIPNPDSLRAIRIIPHPANWYERIVREVVVPSLLGKPRTATLHTERGDIVLNLFGADAPITVWNFISLAKTGWLQKTAFHRVVPNFVIQDGNKRGDGEGGPGYAIRDELNPHRYNRGALGMALSGPDTGGSEYFITHSPQPHLDGGYTVFGEVLRGLKVLDSIVRGDSVRSITISR